MFFLYFPLYSLVFPLFELQEFIFLDHWAHKRLKKPLPVAPVGGAQWALGQCSHHLSHVFLSFSKLFTHLPWNFEF
jgi:hypothetical protein